MPKISSTGEPSYEGHQGVVTNAVGEQFDVDPTRDLDGERKDGYTDEPVGDFEQSSPPGLSGPITQIDEENDEPIDDERDESGRDNDQRPRLVDHRQSEGTGESRKGTTAAKKATTPTSDATKK